MVEKIILKQKCLWGHENCGWYLLCCRANSLSRPRELSQSLISWLPALHWVDFSEACFIPEFVSKPSRLLHIGISKTNLLLCICIVKQALCVDEMRTWSRALFQQTETLLTEVGSWEEGQYVFQLWYCACHNLLAYFTNSYLAMLKLAEDILKLQNICLLVMLSKQLPQESARVSR